MTTTRSGQWPHLNGKTATFITLGCKVNSYETEAMAQSLEQAGVKVIPEEESKGQSADICIVNTCSVTNIADRKSRQMMRRARKSFPGCVVVGVGCYVQAVGTKVQEEGLADLLIGTNQKNGLVPLLEEYYTGPEEELSGIEDTDNADHNVDSDMINKDNNACGNDDTNHAGSTEIMDIIADTTDHTRNSVNKVTTDNPDHPAADVCGKGILLIDLKKSIPYEQQHITRTMEHTRAYVKIQDGCNLFCTYCIIPYTRGRIRSRKPEDILSEVKDLAENGIREIVLTGIHISSYGLENETDPEAKKHFSDGKYFLKLLEELDRIPGISRIRTGSFEPRVVTEAFVEGLKKIKKLCPQFHLSMQSGSDAVLKRMNRHYDTAEYEKACRLLKKAFPDVALTTDVIVGFPGETEEEFAETKAFCERIGFYEMHVFQYSRRAGTVADKMPDQIPESVKKVRSEELLRLTQRDSMEYRRRLLEVFGTDSVENRDAQRIAEKNCLEVLLEQSVIIGGKEYLIGYDRHYVRMALPAREGLTSGMERRVKPTGFVPGTHDLLFAEEIEN